MAIYRKPRQYLGAGARGTRKLLGRVRGIGSSVLGRARGLVAGAGRQGSHVAARMPEAWAGVQTGAENTVTSLQKVPDSELGLLAAASAGLGAGLRIAGAPRVASFAAFVCASILGFAMVSRPGRPAHHAART